MNICKSAGKWAKIALFTFVFAGSLILLSPIFELFVPICAAWIHSKRTDSDFKSGYCLLKPKLSHTTRLPAEDLREFCVTVVKTWAFSAFDYHVDALPRRAGSDWTSYFPALINESTTQKNCRIHACFCDHNHSSVTLMKNHYTFMRIRRHTRPIHLSDNRYLFLLAMLLPRLVSN